MKTLRRTLDAAGHRTTSIVGSDKGWEVRVSPQSAATIQSLTERLPAQPIGSDFLADAGIRSAVSALTQHYPHCDARPGVPGAGKGKYCGSTNHNALQAHRQYGVQLWSSEDYSCWTDSVGAGVWASEINSQWIGGNISMVSAWHLVSAFYPSVAFWNEGMISATQPHSGHYVLSPTVWVSAHTTQFTVPGKSRYLLQGKGAGELAGGGTFVSYVTGEHLTIVIESAGAAVGPFCDANCNGVCQLGPATQTQQATFVLANFRGITKLALWRSQLGANISDAGLFERMPDMVPVVDGRVTIRVEPDSVMTLSTMSSATKAGGVPQAIPPSAPFPLPYEDAFDGSVPPSPGRYWSDMEGGFEISPSASDPRNLVLKQTVVRPACCNFIRLLDGAMPLSILGSSAWENVAASISISLPPADSSNQDDWGVLGLRAKFRAGSFFKGGLGKPAGAFLAVNQHGWVLTDQIGTALPSKAASLASGSFAAPATWRRVTLELQNRTLTLQIDGERKTVPLPAGVATGGGFAAVASSHSLVEFDNFSIRATSTPVSRCGAKPAAGQKIVAVPCGEPAAELGARWDVHPNGLISLRSDPTLCITTRAPVEQAVIAPSPERVWNSTGHDPSIALSKDAAWAEWSRAAPGKPGCDAVALMASPAGASFWVRLAKTGRADAQAATVFADVGWCAPDIELSGATWMGWQKGKAWVFRALNGLFKAADGQKDQGRCIKPPCTPFGAGANVTAIRHSPVELEFLLDGVSTGLVTLSADEALPADAVPCAGGCAGIAMGLDAGPAPPGPPAPPPPPPPPPAAEVVLAKCDAGDPRQHWVVDLSKGLITQGDAGLSVNAAVSAGDFGPVTRSTPSPLWFSPDLGYVHGDSNRPMTCNCLGVC